jgi:hypothetical protein
LLHPASLPAVIDDLLGSALRTRLTIFAGAGISYEAPTNLPLAKGLTLSIISNLCKEAIASEATRVRLEFCLEMMRPERVFSVLYEILGDEAFIPIRFFAGATPNRTHQALAELARYEALAGIITTNFDSAIEQALADRDVPYRLFVLEKEFADNQETTPLPVLKLHGSISEKPQGNGELMVLMEHVGKALPPAKTRTLERFLQTTDVVFVGYSGRDDFDIYPILYRTPTDSLLIWVSHPQAMPAHPRTREGNEYLTYEQLSVRFANWTAVHEKNPDHIDRLVECHALRAGRIETDTTAFVTELAHQFTGSDIHQKPPAQRPAVTAWETKVTSWAETYQNTAIPYLVLWKIHEASGKFGSPSREMLELALAKAREAQHDEYEKLALRWLTEGQTTTSASKTPDKLSILEETSQQQRESGNVIQLPETLLELGIAYSEVGKLGAAVDSFVEAIAVRSKTHDIPKARQRTVRGTPNELRDPIVAQAVAEIVRLLTRDDGWRQADKTLQSLRAVGLDQDTLRYLRPSVITDLTAVAEGHPRRLDDATIERLCWDIEAVCESETREVPESKYVALKLERQHFLSELIDDPASSIAATIHQVLDRIAEAKPESAIVFSTRWVNSDIPLRQWLAARWLGRSDSHLDHRLDLLVMLALNNRTAVREKAAESLGRLAGSHPREVLERIPALAQHEDPRVRMNAALVIEGIGKRNRREALEALVELTADQSEAVRSMANGVTQRLRGSYTRRLIDFIRRS